MKKDIVLIKKHECLSCHYLHAGNETKYPCHKDRNCPAKFFEVVVGLPMLATAKKLAKAFSSNDTAKIAAIMGRLNKVHPSVKDNILNKAKSLLNRDDE